jgi:hypothetical protein
MKRSQSCRDVFLRQPQEAGTPVWLWVTYRVERQCPLPLCLLFAQDNRYRMIIVITGTKTNLFRQSTDRLLQDLRLPDIGRKWKHFANPNLRGTALRSIESALQRWEDESVPEADRQTVLITVMKNVTHLNNLIQLLSSLEVESVPVLVIDDEADQAGLNTMVKQGAESSTYQRLLSLRRRLPHHTFLQYTATPQAPLLINIIDALSPSFAEVLTPGQSYRGGQTFFENQPADLIRIIPDSQIPTTGNILTEPPESLLEAMRMFLWELQRVCAQGRHPETGQ